MPVAFDANFLSISLHPGASVPLDPVTKQPMDRAADRVQALLEKLQRDKIKVVLPWPAIAEFMIFAYPDHIKYLEEFRNAAGFDLADFGQMASIELTEIAMKSGKPSKNQRGEATWAKLKYDRQIIAIAIAKQCTAVYSTDAGVRKLAIRFGMEAFTVADLPDPPPKQEEMFPAQNVVEIDNRKSAPAPAEATSPA